VAFAILVSICFFWVQRPVTSILVMGNIVLQQIGVNLYQLRRILNMRVIQDFVRGILKYSADIGNRIAHANVQMRRRLLI
jgi:hypothetical protein